MPGERLDRVVVEPLPCLTFESWGEVSLSIVDVAASVLHVAFDDCANKFSFWREFGEELGGNDKWTGL